MVKVFEKLAQQLVEEQAELIKKEAIVQGLKKAIREKKLSIVKQCVEGKMLKLDGKTGVVAQLECCDCEDSMKILLHFGVDPIMAVQNDATLTKKERKLLQKYKQYYGSCKCYLDEVLGSDVLDIARQLKKLKHGIELIIPYAWHISYDDATQPDFFVKTGLAVGGYIGCGVERKMLEDVVFRANR